MAFSDSVNLDCIVALSFQYTKRFYKKNTPTHIPTKRTHYTRETLKKHKKNLLGSSFGLCLMFVLHVQILRNQSHVRSSDAIWDNANGTASMGKTQFFLHPLLLFLFM